MRVEKGKEKAIERRSNLHTSGSNSVCASVCRVCNFVADFVCYADQRHVCDGPGGPEQQWTVCADVPEEKVPRVCLCLCMCVCLCLSLHLMLSFYATARRLQFLSLSSFNHLPHPSRPFASNDARTWFSIAPRRVWGTPRWGDEGGATTLI